MKLSHSIKREECVAKLRKYWLLKKDFANDLVLIGYDLLSVGDGLPF